MITTNLMHKLLCAVSAQSGITALFLFIGYVNHSLPPIISDLSIAYSNPLTHVLMLTAIVVGIANFVVGISLIFKIKQKYKSIDSDLIAKCFMQEHNDLKHLDHDQDK